ncbi:GNAT family N-acetyltransferase [Pedobacter sp. HDW13]|uniref:GNAT family N-acetyltransferase n=1 Tax=unclassified Pedobacter TaxID=2628915 RepID=UPI000F598475|nr:MULTISPECIES: GNAT family N-acetyltransferase [unclassified Pedobacter]QIL40024.1 GNAT family N-acetyltransferase [Pedobacter sp. HDW13]RQO65513.1 GNAT family N-acetyltransferase [Pedobacter sp. KBW01]
MTIRLAETTDIAGIMQLVRKVVPLMQAAGNFQWGNDYPNPEVFEKDIALAQLWVAEIDNQIAGVTAITTDQDPEYADAGWDITENAIVTHRLAVNPDLQGKGIARALMQQAETVAQTRNITILRVDTNSENKATQALFPKLGYAFSGEITLAKRPGLRFFCYQKLL